MQAGQVSYWQATFLPQSQFFCRLNWSCFLLLLGNVSQSDGYFRRVLNAAGKIVAPGVTTEEIDALVGAYHTNYKYDYSRDWCSGNILAAINQEPWSLQLLSWLYMIGHLWFLWLNFFAFKVREMAFSEGAYPSPLNYKYGRPLIFLRSYFWYSRGIVCEYCRGFPKSVCTSVNNVVCHGIPDLRWPLLYLFFTNE